MADNGKGAAPQPAAQPGTPPQVKLQVLAQFIRDLSFENGLAQRAFQLQPNAQPDIQVQVSLDARKRDGAEHQFEVTLKFKIESKVKDSGLTLFLLELEYGSLFHIEGVPQDQLHPFLLIECPRIVFPFVRRVVSDITRDGGFPPLNLDLIDFMALYRQELLRQQQAQQGTAKPPVA